MEEDNIAALKKVGFKEKEDTALIKETITREITKKINEDIERELNMQIHKLGAELDDAKSTNSRLTKHHNKVQVCYDELVTIVKKLQGTMPDHRHSNVPLVNGPLYENATGIRKNLPALDRKIKKHEASSATQCTAEQRKSLLDLANNHAKIADAVNCIGDFEARAAEYINIAVATAIDTVVQTTATLREEVQVVDEKYCKHMGDVIRELATVSKRIDNFELCQCCSTLTKEKKDVPVLGEDGVDSNAPTEPESCPCGAVDAPSNVTTTSTDGESHATQLGPFEEKAESGTVKDDTLSAIFKSLPAETITQIEALSVISESASESQAASVSEVRESQSQKPVDETEQDDSRATPNIEFLVTDAEQAGERQDGAEHLPPSPFETPWLSDSGQSNDDSPSKAILVVEDTYSSRSRLSSL